MKNYISVNTKLPKLNMPVLCIIKATCACDHYVPAILARQIVSYDDWEWLAEVPRVEGSGQENSYVKCIKENVKAWKPIEKFPVKFVEGFER